MISLLTDFSMRKQPSDSFAKLTHVTVQPNILISQHNWQQH